MNETYYSIPSDDDLRKPTPAALPAWHFERLTKLDQICEWERFEDAGCLDVGDIVRVVNEDVDAENIFDGQQQFLVVRKPVRASRGWITYTQPVHHTTFHSGS